MKLASLFSEENILIHMEAAGLGDAILPVRSSSKIDFLTSEDVLS